MFLDSASVIDDSNPNSGSEMNLTSATKIWHRKDGHIASIARVGERLVYGSWSGKLLSCDFDLGSRAAFAGWNNVRK
jgi:hypothetical protein